MSYLLQTARLTKVYNGRETVSDVNMHVRRGEIYGFLGPNGSGKTTVLRMLTNLVKPTQGDIEMFGEPVAEHSYEVLKRIGSVIEYPVFYDHLTAEESLQLHCRYMGYYKEGAVEEALALVGLRDVEHKPVKQFSLGMKQRLGIARAIITRPELLLLDEPINGLDPHGIREVRSLLQQLCREHGMTIVVSSHILAEIEHIADTIGVINGGRLIEEVSMAHIRGMQTEYIELSTPDVERAALVLEMELHVANFKVSGDRLLRIYDWKQSASELAKQLVQRDVAIEAIHRKHHNLEEYFFQLLGGVDQHA